MNDSSIFFVLDDKAWFSSMCFLNNRPWEHVLPRHFQNGEIAIHLSKNVVNKAVFLLKRFTSHFHEDIFELLQCVDTLNRMGAKTITLLLPYYPYARQDHASDCTSKGALLLAKMLATLGVEKIITIDMHAPGQISNFPTKVVNITMEYFWEKYLLSLGYNHHKIQIIAADKSAVQRVQQIASKLNCPWGYVNKRRDTDGEIHIKDVFNFYPEKQTFLIDDLIDTGRTIIAAAQNLKKRSTQSITACITHCNLSDTLIENLKKNGITKIVTTDTLKTSLPFQTSSDTITLLETLPLLLNEIPMS